MHPVVWVWLARVDELYPGTGLCTGGSTVLRYVMRHGDRYALIAVIIRGEIMLDVWREWETVVLVPLVFHNPVGVVSVAYGVGLTRVHPLVPPWPLRGVQHTTVSPIVLRYCLVVFF